MKKHILILILLAVGAATQAQSLKVTDDKLDRVVLAVNLNGLEMANLEMKQELHLTDEQYSQIERVNEQRFSKMMEAEQMYADNDVLRSKSFNAIKAETDQSLKGVLDAQQMRQFQELEGRFNVQYVSDNEE
jgi:hypothetical protein